MGNYHYIIAGLPDIVLSADNRSFSYDALKDGILVSLTNLKDRRLVEWLEFGDTPDNLNAHFYRAALACKNSFISSYYKLDLEIRNRKVEFINKAQGESNVDKYKVFPAGYTPMELDASENELLNEIFGNSNILEKERLLDKFKWDYINTFNKYGDFNISVILAFLAKGKLIDRWNKLDKDAGEEMFKRLVDEVRGTFNGIDLKNI